MFVFPTPKSYVEDLSLTGIGAGGKVLERHLGVNEDLLEGEPFIMELMPL